MLSEPKPEKVSGTEHVRGDTTLRGKRPCEEVWSHLEGGHRARAADGRRPDRANIFDPSPTKHHSSRWGSAVKTHQDIWWEALHEESPPKTTKSYNSYNSSIVYKPLLGGYTPLDTYPSLRTINYNGTVCAVICSHLKPLPV